MIEEEEEEESFVSHTREKSTNDVWNFSLCNKNKERIHSSLILSLSLYLIRSD